MSMLATMRAMIINQAAKTAHEVNRAFCASIGDTSQVAWEDCDPELRLSAIDGITKIFDGEVTSPEQSHDNWSAFKEANGWVYGPEKDATKKTHPCLVPYDELPAEQQTKDALLFAVAMSFLPSLTDNTPDLTAG